MLAEGDGDSVLADAGGQRIVDDDDHQVRIHLLGLGDSLDEEVARACDEPVALVIEVGNRGEVVGRGGSGRAEVGALESELIGSLLDALICALVEGPVIDGASIGDHTELQGLGCGLACSLGEHACDGHEDDEQHCDSLFHRSGLLCSRILHVSAILQAAVG